MNIDQQITCVEREIRFRERLYPRWIAANKITSAKSEHEISCMKAVLVTLREVKGRQVPPQLALNGG